MLPRKHVCIFVTFLFLMPPRCHGLLYALSRAGLLRGSLERHVRDNDIVEFVLGDDIDRVRICRC
jgi:hypothetical protein